jgi:hypothetical protein
VILAFGFCALNPVYTFSILSNLFTLAPTNICSSEIKSEIFVILVPRTANIYSLFGLFIVNASLSENCGTNSLSSPSAVFISLFVS